MSKRTKMDEVSSTCQLFDRTHIKVRWLFHSIWVVQQRTITWDRSNGGPVALNMSYFGGYPLHIARKGPEIFMVGAKKNRFLQRATFVWQIWGVAIINYPQHLHSFRPSAFIKGVLGHNQLTCIGTIQMFIYCIPIPSLL